MSFQDSKFHSKNSSLQGLVIETDPGTGIEFNWQIQASLKARSKDYQNENHIVEKDKNGRFKELTESPPEKQNISSQKKSRNNFEEDLKSPQSSMRLMHQSQGLNQNFVTFGLNNVQNVQVTDKMMEDGSSGYRDLGSEGIIKNTVYKTMVPNNQVDSTTIHQASLASHSSPFAAKNANVHSNSSPKLVS